MYKCTCSGCGNIRYLQHMSEISTSRCINCYAVRFGLQKYFWVNIYDPFDCDKHQIPQKYREQRYVAPPAIVKD